ncbi:MAG: hypothetical protein JJ896_16985 [Rhodothermales bacterium]|nr:hypothetical protein [Rhodothermales bacterium]MBO6781355.1 hypothetical protein [Rhodothermales bacterium]
MRPIVTEPLVLKLARPFRIAHGVSAERTNVLVRLGEAVGEAGLPPYLGVGYPEVAAWLDGVKLPEWNPDSPPPIRTWISNLPDGPAAARCALDLALHDWWAQAAGQPLHAMLGLDPSAAPASYRTVGIPETGAAPTLPEGDRLKLKLGSGDTDEDVRVARTVRLTRPEAELCVDANGGWSIPEAVRIIPQLAELKVSFIEQPIAQTDPEDWHLLRRLLAPSGRPPLIADESAHTVDDLIALAGAADGVNVKLAKCGGIAATLKLIDMARALDMQVVLGCMVESAVAITAAAHLASLADFTDLDGAELIANPPFEGVALVDGHPRLPVAPGIGVRATMHA